MSPSLRRLAAFSLVLLLGACAGGTLAPAMAPAVIGSAAPPDAPGEAEPSPPLHERLVASDGIALPLRVWLPRGPVKAAVVGVHGFNDYSNAFAGPAAEWARHGIATYAYDQRGFGEAPQRGRWAGARQLDDDLTAATRLVHARHPGVPVFLLGESMGGAVVITAVTGAAGAPRPLADGIILAAPAVWGRETMNLFERVALWSAYRVAPALTLSGRGLHIRASDNLAMLRALGRDPLVIKETRVDAVEGLVDLMDLALGAAPRLTTPMLLLYGERDEIIPRDATLLMIDRLPPAFRARRRIAWYPEGYHMLLRDLEAPLVMRDVEAWMADPAAPLPSGADRIAREALVAAKE